MISDTNIETYPAVKFSYCKSATSLSEKKQLTEVLAPISGYVTLHQFQLDQRVPSNSTLMAIFPLNEVLINANFKETQLNNMRIGQPVMFINDFYGNNFRFYLRKCYG